MCDKVKECLLILCLINVVIKDMDIFLCGEGCEEGVSDDDIFKIFVKMVK